MKAWQQDLTPLIKELGGDLVGYARLSDVPEAQASGFSGGISIGVALKPHIVKDLFAGPTLAYHLEYHRVNGILDQLDHLAADWLIAHGYSAHPLTRANVPIDWETMETPIPHKTAALRAGHGWIGRSALLVTPKYGSAIRFSTVLTNAPIEGVPLHPDRCGSCTACREACPVSAILGVPWKLGATRKDYYNAGACKGFAESSCQKIGVKNDICGICIHACPYTLKYLRNTE